MYTHDTTLSMYHLDDGRLNLFSLCLHLTTEHASLTTVGASMYNTVDSIQLNINVQQTNAHS